MDRKIEKKPRPLWHWILASSVIFALGSFVFQMLIDASIPTYRVSREQLIVSTVQHGAFEDLIPIRGSIQPLNTVYLDAVNGGVVEEIFVEEGALVEEGQSLLLLSNTNLRLSAAQTDASITEQLNLLSNISNGLDTEKLRTEREIIDIEYRITVLERKKSRYERLANDGLISREDYDSVVDELVYQRRILANTQSRRLLESEIREERTEQIAEQTEKLEENLGVSQASFENLLVKAPISGQLTSLAVETGESKLLGERLGQIDLVDQYKIVAQIDEYYVSRVSLDQVAQFTLEGKDYSAGVTKIYPEVVNGTFEVDLTFSGSTPENMRRGQTLQMELTLGSPMNSLLLPLGGFIQDTGGNWVFLLDETGDFAYRRDIQVGRRNNRFIEVRSGLDATERVITSGYSSMQDVERIALID